MSEKTRKSMLRRLNMLKSKICCCVVNWALAVIEPISSKAPCYNLPKKGFNRVATMSIFWKNEESKEHENELSSLNLSRNAIASELMNILFRSVSLYTESIISCT